MTHTGPIPESDGGLHPEPIELRHCRKCDRHTFHHCWRWDSFDGAYEDYKYQCVNCATVHWVDGIDS